MKKETKTFIGGLVIGFISGGLVVGLLVANSLALAFINIMI